MRIGTTQPVVLSVGGGKGGIGKSAITANLGLILARLEHKVTLVDADLGGSDLHNILGLENDRAGLGEVLAGGEVLEKVIYPVLEPRLKFIPGDAMMVATANPGYQRKRKLLHGVKNLPSDFVLLDLGAGTAITTMDFYLASPLSLLIMLPERPAMLNAFNFMKNALFRALERAFKDSARSKRVLKEFQLRGRGPGAMRLADLAAALDQTHPGQGSQAWEVTQTWRPKLILNRVRRMDDFYYASQLERWAREDLGLLLEVLGFLPEDDVHAAAAAENMAAMDYNPRAPFCRALTLVGLRLSAWAGRAEALYAFREFSGSFERTATEFASLFPPPGTTVPTRDELLRRINSLERKLK